LADTVGACGARILAAHPRARPGAPLGDGRKAFYSYYPHDGRIARRQLCFKIPVFRRRTGSQVLEHHQLDVIDDRRCVLGAGSCRQRQ
jgi:hypothetical protein